MRVPLPKATALLRRATVAAARCCTPVTKGAAARFVTSIRAAPAAGENAETPILSAMFMKFCVIPSLFCAFEFS
jgi:hypothetical protein